MANWDELKQTFFEETNDGLEAIDTGLTQMRDGAESEDTVNAVFRAIHSVKGGAGVFGFESLVSFAHAFETVLDAVRHGTLAATAGTLDVLFVASDVLADMVAMARVGETVPQGYGGDCKASLEQLIGREESGEGGELDDAGDGMEGLDFTPVRIDDFAPADEASERSYAIRFRPRAEMLASQDPLFILLNLRTLGTLELEADTAALPPLADLSAGESYIGWRGTLRSTWTRQDVDQVFAFVAGKCDYEVAELDAPAPVVDCTADAMATAASHEPPLVPAPDLVPAAPEPAAASISASGSDPAPAPFERMAGDAGPAAKSAGKEGRAASTMPAATTIRVELEKIDRVVNMVGEMVIAQAMLGQIVEDLPGEVSGRLSQTLEELVHHTRELKNSVMSMRAQPVKSVFQRMTRLVRELSAKTAKKVHLEMLGENTEVDKTIIERLSDPITHIIRNSIDHGIESPAARLAAGKKEVGTILLSAEQRGGRIVIEIRDDGAGIDSERVLEKARRQGLVAADAVLNQDEINNLVFMPGFSTAETISDISGRGVGMDVVRRNIQDLGGRITLKSERGRGLNIELALPLTLAVMDGMIVRVAQETYVMPISAIVECIRPARNDMRPLVGTSGALQVRGRILPLVYLGDLFDVPGFVRDPGECTVIIIEGTDGTQLGLVVDELCGHQQVVIKSIEENYGRVPGVAAATILGNGRVAFIVDIEKISELADSASCSAPPPRLNGRAAVHLN